jgi:hypothetical protein
MAKKNFPKVPLKSTSQQMLSLWSFVTSL